MFAWLVLMGLEDGPIHPCFRPPPNARSMPKSAISKTSTSGRRSTTRSGSVKLPSDETSVSVEKGDSSLEASYASDLRHGLASVEGEPNAGASPSSVADGSGSLEAPEVDRGVAVADRGREVLRVASEAFARTGSWVVFYRWMLAPGGVVDQVFESPEERRFFETQDEFIVLLEMLTSIRSQDTGKAGMYEPERVITVRMPRSMHEGIVRETQELGLSVNKFCITKLLQPANKKFTPEESGFRRGRRPGPQIIAGKTKVPTAKKRRRKKND